MKIGKVPLPRTPALVVLGSFAALWFLERRFPLRRNVEPRDRRDLRNLALAATTALVLRVVEKPVVGRLSRLVENRSVGLLPSCGLPRQIEAALALLLLDYTLYVWHVLLHRVPLLWRCHLVHHVDLDLSATTAFRFHFTEMVLSVPWRAAQVLLIGVRPAVLELWQTATLAEILFHHSNLRLPRRLERLAGAAIVTPRIHGIHHSSVRKETDSNWSSGLTLWDWLHGTLRLDVPQNSLTIGTPAYRDPAELALPELLAMPFVSQKPAWQASSNSPHLPCS